MTSPPREESFEANEESFEANEESLGQTPLNGIIPLSEKNLKKYGIFYEKNPEAATDLPDHVDYLKSALLDFDWTISHRLGLRDDVQDMRDFQLNDAFDRLHINDAEREAVRGSVEKYKKVQDDADDLIRKRSKEKPWDEFFSEHFFGPLKSALKPSDTDTRR